MKIDRAKFILSCVLTGLGVLVVLWLLFMINGCGSGGVRDVVGAYFVTGTADTTLPGEESPTTDDVTGLITASQNGSAVESVSCIGRINTGGSLDCNGSTIYDLSWFGPVVTVSEGTIVFKDGSVEVDTSYEITFEWTGESGRVRYKLTGEPYEDSTFGLRSFVPPTLLRPYIHVNKASDIVPANTTR